MLGNQVWVTFTFFLLMPILQGGSLLQRVRRQYTTAMTKSKVPIQLHCQSVTKKQTDSHFTFVRQLQKTMKNIHSKQKMRKSRAESDTNVVGEKRRHGKATNNRVDT